MWLGGIANLVVGFYKAHGELKQRAAESERWFRSVMQLAVTSWIAFTTGWAVFGLGFLGLGRVLELVGVTAVAGLPTLPPLGALIAGFFCGLLTCAGAVVKLWKSDPLLKSIPIWAPQAAEETALAAAGTLTDGSVERENK